MRKKIMCDICGATKLCRKENDKGVLINICEMCDSFFKLVEKEVEA